MRILVVEDEYFTAKMLRDYSEMSYPDSEVVLCHNAEMALEQFLKEPFLLIVLDIMLPGMTGIDFCKKIRSLPDGKQCHIIAITAGDTSTFLHEILEAGANDYISKPFDIDTFSLRLKVAQYRINEVNRSNQTSKLLEETKDTARALLNASLDIIFLADKEGIILDCNNKFLQRHQKDFSELIGTSIWDLLTKDIKSISKERFRKTIQSKQSARKEIQIEDKWYDHITHPILNAKNEVSRLAVIARDITERKSKDKLLIEAKEKAELSNVAKSEFLANMRHEINTPLNAIVGFGQILIKYSKKQELPDQLQQHLETIIECSYSLSEMMTNILNLAQMDSGKIVVNQEEVDLKQLFQGIFHIQKTKAKQKKLNYNYHYDTKLPKKILSDRTLLNKILLFLSSNAIKFTSSEKSVWLNAKKDGETLVFEFVDEGIGISEEQKKQIFNIFEQVDSSTTRQYEGIGIGLPVTKKMVELMGGTIAVESKLGKGSMFTVKIPLVACSPAEATDFFISADYKFSRTNTVLVADDNPINIKMIKVLFDDFNIIPFFAKNGKEAVDKTLELVNINQTPDLILMDVFMPVLNGLDATRKILSNPSCAKIPIIVLSAESSIQRQQEAFKIGVCGYITKPINFQKLIPLLAKYLKQDQPEIIQSGEAIVQNRLPGEIKQDLTKGFEKFSEISIFETEKLFDQIDAMKSILAGFNTPYQALLEKLEEPAMNADEHALKKLINQYFESN